MPRYQTNFTSIDMLDASQANLVTEAAPQAQPVAAAPAEVNDEVPTGSVDDITAWVGDDKKRAQLALDAETERSTPRKTLVAAMNDVLGA